jgi:hypothetical protein
VVPLKPVPGEFLMTYAFGIYFEDDDNLGLVAAGSRWNSGGNSTLARRARVALQRRDRYGRWAEMGGGISFKGRFGNTGQVMDAVGRYVGPAERENYMRVYVTSGRGLQTGVYEVPSKVATVAKALLTEEALKDVGVNLDVNGNSVGDVLDRDIEFFAGMFKGKPTEFELDMARKNLTKAETRVIAKARLKAPAHKSYNVVDKDGNRVDKDEEPTKPDVKKPSKKAKPAEVFPIPDLSKLDDKERNRREWYVDANGKRIPANKLTDADKTPENRRIRDLDNHRVLDGNGNLVEFKPEYKPEANPVPQGEFKPVEDSEEGFWNANQVKPGEVQKNLSTPEEVYEALYNGGFVEVSPELALAAIDVAMKDLPFLGKDENPLFQSNPTDPRFREIANILASLPSAQETRLKRAINLALMSEEKIDALKAYLNENSEEGIGLSPEAMAELHKNFRNLGVDITNMRIKGQDAFSNDNLGAERINMPQLDAADQEDFLAYAKRLGVGFKEAVARPQDLHPIQAEMDMGDVGKIKASWLDPELRKKYGMDDQFLFVTRDGYVLDGHHRWSSALLAEMESGKPINLKVMVLDMDHEDALKFVNEYNDHVGITRQMVGGKNVAQPRPEKQQLPSTPSVVSDESRLAPNYAPEGPTPPSGGDENIVTPGGENFLKWLDRELANNGDKIILEFSAKLTNDTPNPENRNSPFPGSRTVVNNLLAYRDSLMLGLKESALDANAEKFKFQFEIAKRVTKLLNKIHENFSNDKKYGADTELEISTSNPEEKLKTVRILPETIITETDNNGIQKIKSFSSVIIAKNGKPFLIKWTPGSSNAYSIGKDGVPNTSADGGGISFHEVQSYSRIVDGKPVPDIAHVGGAFTDDNHHALGLASAHILLTRWVQTKFFGAKLQHSSNLSARGNPYSKMVSRDMRWNNRAQADKAVQMSCPNADIFKVLKAMRLIDGEFIPATPGVSQNDNTPGGYGPSSGGTGWLKRLTFTNNGGWSDNTSKLTKFSVNDIVSNLDSRFTNKTDEEQQAILDAMPPIFRDYFAGDRSRNVQDRCADFDVQYNLLGTAYSDGMKQQETVDFLNTLINGLPQLYTALGQDINSDRGAAERIPQLETLRDAVNARAWDQSNNNYNRPKPFNTNSIRAIQSPFAGHFKFNEWVLPSDVDRIMNDLPFNARPRKTSQHPDWTEDPQRLQELYGPETLLDSLRDAILNQKGKFASLPALSTGADGENRVNPTAVYKALENHGYDTEKILAGIYDELNGNTANTDALTAKRSELGNLQNIIEQLAREVGQLDEPVEFSRIGGDYDPAEQILQSDLVKRGDIGEMPTALQLQPLALDNESYDFVSSTGNRSSVLKSAPYNPQIALSKFYVDGVADNPKIIARNFNPTGLRNALVDAITNNRHSVKLRFPNGNTLIVDNAAIRDALQLQGYDINKVLSEQPSVKPAVKSISNVSETSDAAGIVTTDYAIGTDLPTGPGLRQRRDDLAREYDFSVVNLSSPSRDTVAQIAKVKKNADGKFEVWVAQRADGKTDEFTGEPNGIYENLENAIWDVRKHLERELNIGANTGFLRIATKPTARPDYTIVGGKDDESQITVGDMVLTKPDGAEAFVVYTNGDDETGFRRIPGSEDGASSGSVYTQTVQSAGDTYTESFNHVSKDADGKLKEKQVFAITQIGDKYQLTAGRFSSDSATPDVSETLVFNNYDDAKDYATRRLISGKIGFVGTTKNFPNLTARAVPTSPKADLPNQQIIQDATSIQIATPATMAGGIAGELKITVQKGAHPTWRNQAVNAPYVFAEFSFSPPSTAAGEAPYVTGQIVRTGRMEWQVKIKGNSFSFSDITGLAADNSLKSGNTYESSKEDAINRLRKKLDSAFGITDEQRNQGDSVLPKIRLVNRAAQLEPRPTPPPSNDPTLLADGVFDEFLAVRNTPLDIPNATSRGYMGLGQSGSQRFETPDGKNFKVKDEGSRKAASESLNHALHLVLGIQATSARTGKAPGTNNAVNLIDPFEPDIVRGAVNGHMNAQELFTTAEFTKPENQQAIADIQEGLVIDYWLGNVDFVLNTGNSFVAVRDGVRRGVRCDVGGGMFSAIRQQLIGDWPNGDSAVRDFKSYNNDFMGQNDTVAGSTTNGHMRRGLTKDKYVEIAKRTLLRLTDDKIDRIVDAHITDPTDADRAKQGLKARRLAMLNYLGIDPNEAQAPAQPAPTNAVAPNPQLGRDGYEFLGNNPEGKKIIRVGGQIAPDGIFIASISTIPKVVRDKIIDGTYVPENLPLRIMDRDNPSNDILIDGAGIVRPWSALGAGYTSLIIRRKLSNGQYAYLITRPGPSPRGAHAQANEQKFGPLIGQHTLADQSPTAKKIIDGIFGGGGYSPGDRVVAEKELLLDIPGLLGKQRVLVADVDDFDFSAARDYATRQGIIGPSKFAVGADFIKSYPDTALVPQAPGDGDRIANKLREWEQNWHSTASNIPTVDDGASGGDDGSGPSNPGGGGNGPTPPPMSGSDDDWQQHMSMSQMTTVPGMPEREITISVSRRADGAIKVVNASDGNVLLGHVKPLEHGHWVATFMPDNIGANNNIGAKKAFFANKIDAQNWLTKQIGEKYGIREDFRRRYTDSDSEIIYDGNVNPPFVVDRGFLNPSTDAQSRLAKRLVKGKKATPEERAMYKAILSQRNPTVGDVGWVIGQLRDREDRDSAELAASKQAQKDALNAGNPIRESSLDNGGDGSNRERTVLAKNLQVGERILGNINADVVFTVPGENDTINIGVVGDDGKLKVYKVNRNRGLVCIYGRQAPVAPAQQGTPHPAIAARANRSRLIQEAVRAEYPNAHTLPNGDLVIGQRDHRQADGRVFRYEAVVHKLKSDEFVGYVRRQLLDANGNPTGTGEAAYLTKPAHSPRALKNRLSLRVIPALMANNPANGFNQPNGDRQNEATDPATGLPLPESLVSQTRFVGNTGIESTGHPAKDALIEYVQTLVARGVSAPDIINQVVGTNQNLFSRQQMDDIIERLEANRLYPGVNVIPYVSKDNKTIVRVGDRVTHFDAFGQPKMMANGLPRTGIVTERRPYTLNVKPNGDYEYTDQVYVQWDDTQRPHQAAPRRLEVNRRADGSAPVPAVQNADSGETPPYIETMPVQPKRVVPRPVAPRRQPPVAPPTDSDLQDIANIGNVRIVVVPNGPTYEVERENNGTQFRDVQDGGYSDIYVVERNGKWAVKKMDGVNRQTEVEFDTRNEAEARAMDIITGTNAPATPVAFPDEGDTAQRGTLINSNTVGGFSRVVDPSGMGHTIMRGVNMTRFDKDQGDWQDDAIYVQQRADGKWHVVQQIPDGNGGHTVRSVAINDDRNMSEAIATNFVAGNSTPEEYMRMWGDPNQANAPENNPQGGEGGVPDWAVEDLPKGNWRNGEPSGGISDPDAAQYVRTFWDDDQPPTQYEVNRSENGTKFVGIGGDNEGAEAFIRVEKTELGNWKVVDPRNREGIDTDEFPAEYGDRNVAEALAINKMAGRQELNRDILNQPDSAAPAVEPEQQTPSLDIPWNDKRNIIQPQEVGAIRSFEIINDEGNGSLEPIKIDIVRDPASTRFLPEGLNYEDMEVLKFTAGWGVTNLTGDSDEVRIFGTRADAEAAAVNSMIDFNRDAKEAYIARQNPNNQQPASEVVNEIEAVDGLIVNRSEGMSLFNNPDGSINEIQVVSLGGGKAWQVVRNSPGQDSEVLSTHATREDGEAEARARIAQENDGNSGGNPPAGPGPSDGGDGGVPPTNNPPVGPAGEPATPEADETFIPIDGRGRPKPQGPLDIINPESPTDGGNPTGGPATPEARPAQAPRLPKPRVNPVQPGERFVRYHAGRDGKYWDIIDRRTRRKIGRAGTIEEANEMAAGLRGLDGKLIDYNTPVTPRQPRPQAPANQASQAGVSRADLGDGVFSVNNGNGEYGIAVRGSDGKWSARVHENPRDAVNNANPISSGTYDTEQEAEDAMRQIIAERQAQRDAANVLQWQSGSDGKQYLGLDGVAGVDAENAPVYGISPSPFGGWAMARWDSKAAKDAGAPPNSIVAQPDEEAAKNDALQQINDFLRNLTGQNPPLVNDENPTTPTNREEQLPPGVTLQDQVDAGLTTPFNPNANLPGSNPPKA